MAKAKGHGDGMVSSNENRPRPLSSGGVEGLSWPGPRTLLLQKNSLGFGFTLRHFIVYPPESSLQSPLKDDENGNENDKGGQRSRLEPMDTIFVKSVKDKGPAQLAGLCTGDRLVKVNGETVLGKTYSQVISLIQNSQNILELSIMPKDEDVLQLVSAFSQDAYLTGNEPYSGEAQDLPKPPSLSYSGSKPSCTPLQGGHDPHHSSLDNRHPHAAAAAAAVSPLDNRTPGAAAPPTHTSGWPGACPDPGAGHLAASGREWHGRSSSIVTALDFHFANHNAAIASATLPPPRKGSLPGTSRSHSDALCHQALSDWYYSQAEAAELMSPPRHCSVSQDRLADLGLSPALGPASKPESSANHRRRETLLYHQQTTTCSPDPGWRGGGPWGPGNKSCSESLLAAYAEYEHTYGRSRETLAQATALIAPHAHQPHPPGCDSQGSHSAKGREPKQEQRPSDHQVAVTYPVTAATATAPPRGRQVAEPQTRTLQQEEVVGYKSYSPSFCRKADHLLQQAHSFRESNYSSPYLAWSPSEGEGGAVPRPRSTPAMPSEEEEEEEEEGEAERQATPPSPLSQEVVLRQKPPSGRRTLALRHTSYAPTLEHTEPPGTLPSAGWRGGSLPRRVNGSLAQHTLDSLSSIPFIDEPTSPSVDLQARPVQACLVVSVPDPPASTVLTPNTVTPTLSHSTTAPCVRLRPKDCSMKGRRSSYLLAITTERSKSCDEGLNTFREEGRVFSRLPKRVKSFFTDGSLETLRAQEEARSKRHSTSELGTITFSNVRREGWLHSKQILTEKGKKLGGSMRPWKRVFSVLRSHSLFLYKDKREAVLHGAGAPGQDHQPPICIRGCLVDIAYSETKRKHALRLTTQDFCEYLLQADDREDMLAWIKVIRENGKTDNEEFGFSRQALISKKLNDYRKQSPTGSKPDASPKATRLKPPFLSKMDNAAGAPRSPKTEGKEESSPPKSPWGINIIKKSKKSGPKAFGVRLEDCQPGANNKFIPLIVEICCGLVEEMGLEYTGIYRVPGNNAMVSTLQDQLNKGLDINPTEEKWQDLNVVSSLLKSFFRKLPEPVFTDDKYNDFIDANRLDTNSERLKTMNKLIRDLPDYYYHTLKFLIGHLKTVADHSDKNKMEPRNLALVFGPTLVRTSEDNMTDMVTHMPDRYKIVETLIQHYIWFFTDEMDMDDKTPVETGDVQPAPNIDHLLSNIGRTAYLGEASDSTNSEGAKSKMSWGSKKDLTAKDFLTLSIMSAVTGRKRRKRHGRRGAGSTDDDAEPGPVKPSQSVESEEGEEAESPAGGDTAPRAVGEEDEEEEEEEEEEGGEQDVARRQEAFQTIVQVTEESGGVGVSDAAGETLLLATQVEERSQGASMPREEEEETEEEVEEVEKDRAGAKGSPWRSPEDARSIVSGYSTLSTLGRSLRSHGDDGDDENSELVSETDNESGFASRSVTQERPEKHPVPAAAATPPAEATPHATATPPASPAATAASQRSFLYTHYKTHPPVLSPTPLLAPPTPEPAERGEGGAGSTTPSSSSSSAAAHRLHSRPSFNSHRLIQCDTLARKKAKARSMDLLDSLGPDRAEGGPRPKRDPSRTNPSSGSSQESLRPAPPAAPGEAASFAPSGGQAQGRGSLVDQVRARLLGSADDLRTVGLRKPLSPETRRKRRAWRRHTVVASPTETTGKRPLLLTGDLPLAPIASGLAKPAAPPPPPQRPDPEPEPGREDAPTSRRGPPSRFSQYL